MGKPFRMDRFFLHLHECGTLVEDEEGRDLPDAAAARDAAIKEARHVMSDEVLHGRLCLSCCIVIEDAEHVEIGRVPFKDAVVLSGL